MPGTSVTNPLQAIIASAAKSTPAVTGETARHQARFAAAGTARLILCDVSASMGLPAGGNRRRIDHLRDALRHVQRPEHRVMAFSVDAAWVNGVLPEPHGCTDMALAIERAWPERPVATLVISDGEPDSPEQALAAAARLSGTINVLYCGDETNLEAINFMRRLARAGCGRCHVHSWATQASTPIAHTMQMLLGARGS
jgi:hypothetical protein